jgi:hypothetical protein
VQRCSQRQLLYTTQMSTTSTFARHPLGGASSAPMYSSAHTVYTTPRHVKRQYGYAECSFMYLTKSSNKCHHDCGSSLSLTLQVWWAVLHVELSPQLLARPVRHIPMLHRSQRSPRQLLRTTDCTETWPIAKHCQASNKKHRVCVSPSRWAGHCSM